MSLQLRGARASPGALSFVKRGKGGVQRRGQHVASRRMLLSGLVDLGKCGVEGLLDAGEIGL